MSRTSGRTKAYLGLGVIQAVFLGFAYCIGVNWGMIGVATAYVAYTYLTLLQTSTRDLGGVPSNVFFESLLAMTVEGYFGDPVYGGNWGMAAWTLLMPSRAQARCQPCFVKNVREQPSLRPRECR